MEDLPDIEIRRVPTLPIYRKDRHLSSALITSEIEYMFENRSNPRALKKEHIALLEKLTPHICVRDSKGFLGWAFDNMSKFAKTDKSNAILTRAIQAASEALRVSTLDYIGTPIIKHITPDEHCYKVFWVKKNISDALNVMSYKHEINIVYNVGSVKCETYGNLHVVWVNSNTCFVITHSHFVALGDVFNSWFDVSLYAQLCRGKYPGHDLYDEVKKVLYAGAKLVSEKNQSAYDLFKMWPSLAISCILKDREDSAGFHNAITVSCGPFLHTDIYKLMTRQVCNDYDVHLVLELSGMWKCFGHPNIDVTSSVNEWVKKGSVMRPGLDEISSLILWTFRLEFCRQYYREKRKWPNVTVYPMAPNFVIENHRNNTWGEQQVRPWRAEDFEHVKLRHTLDFDYHVDLSDLLSDKSIIPGRSHWIYEYDSQVHRTRYGRFPRGPPRQSKSVIINYLSREVVDVRDILRQIENNVIPEEWKVMVAVIKEREFKWKNGRMFGMLHPDVRLYQTATESNIASHIFPFIKHQSMTMSEEELTRTILKMNSPILKIEGETYVFIVLDFSSWCSTFRLELVAKLFSELDDLFGVCGVYLFTHLFPLMSVLLFQDRFNPPQQGPNGDPMEGARCLYGPEAWLEGLRQKGWTLATILLILLASWRCGTSASLLGQGDNQVILLRIPPLDQLNRQGVTQEQYIDNYLVTLRELCDRAGIIIKLEETWHSRDLFEYSRKYHYKGAQVSNAMKKVSRLSSESNQTLPTVTGDIAGLFSAGSSLAAEDCTPTAAYFCTVVEASLRYWDAMPWLTTAEIGDTVCLMLLSRTLGGYPITLYSQFCTRAVQDTLTSNLHLVKTVMRDPLLRSSMARLCCLRLSNHRDPLSLIKDPQSIPLDIPRQPENYVKGEIKKGIPGIIVNRAVKCFFDMKTEEAVKSLVEDLMGIRPCNPKLLNKLYTLSNIGVQEKWTAKFSNTRSIQNVAMKEWASEPEMMRKVNQIETTYSRYLEKKRQDPELQELLDAPCVTTYAQQLRERAWGVPMEGITMPPQQEQVSLREWHELSPEESSRAILFTSRPAIVTERRDLTRGPYTPYYGSATRLRARKAPLQVVEVGTTVSSLKQLMELRGWVKGNDIMTDLIDRLIQEKTTLSVDDIAQFTRQVYSGCITHRLPCPALQRSGMANQNLNHSSYYMITSDTATKYGKGGINYTICFQSVFLHGLSVLAHFYHDLYVHLDTRIGAVFSCNDCTWELPPEQFTLAELSYPGVHMENQITELHHKGDHESYNFTATITLEDSYTVHMSRKFAAWIINSRVSDRVSTLENVSIEDNMIAAFVNLAEFSRLSVPLFIRSYIFYCTIYDSSYYGESYSFYEDILNSSQKTPYDVLLDSMTKCNLMRALAQMSTAPHKRRYTSEDQRCLLYDVVSMTQSDMKELLKQVYILTPEDKLHTVIRAMQVKLYWLKEPCLINTGMTGEELEEALNEYSDDLRKELEPKVSVSEEEAIAWIRSQEIRETVRIKIPLCMDFRTNPLPCPEETACPFNHLTYTIGRSMYASALVELLKYSILRERVSQTYLVTHDDTDGLVYAAVAHEMNIQSGYPHWVKDERELMRDQGPEAVLMDNCCLRWDRDAYICNAPKIQPVCPEGTFHIVLGDSQPVMKSTDICLILVTKSTEIPGYPLLCLKSHVKRTPLDTWVLCKPGSPHVYVPTGDMSRAAFNAITALRFVETDLVRMLHEDHCLSAFSGVGSLLGCIPDTSEKFFECFRTKKNKFRKKSPKQKKSESLFAEKSKKLFDVAQLNSIQKLDENKKVFLAGQKSDKRYGFIDENVLNKQIDETTMEIDVDDLNQPTASSSNTYLGNNALSRNQSTSGTETVTSSSQRSENISEYQVSPKKQKVLPKIDVMNAELASALDRANISNGDSTYVLAAAYKSAGINIETHNLSCSTIRRARIMYRQSITEHLKNEFKIEDRYIVHWDGKILTDIVDPKSVDKIAILLSSMKVRQLLGVSKIFNGSAENHSVAILNTLNNWNVTPYIKAMCFDTTAVNTGAIYFICSLTLFTIN